MSGSLIASSLQLERLAYKYKELARLRRAHARGMPEAPTSELRALAMEFPGALSELDTMALEEIDARHAELAEVMAHGADQPAPSRWMLYVIAYHEALKLTLHSRSAQLDVNEARARSGLPIDAEFLETARQRPGGRVVPGVLSAIARWSGEDPSTIEAIILPRRRKARSRG